MNKVPIKVTLQHRAFQNGAVPAPVRLEGEPVDAWHPVIEFCRMAGQIPGYAYHILFEEVIVHYVQLTNCVHEGKSALRT